jgi:hypothetical protein
MNIIHVFEEIDQKLDEADIRDKWGERLPGILCGGYANWFSGGRWNEMIDEVRNGSLSLEKFRAEALDIIDLIQRHRFRRKLKSRIADLELDQRELEGA